MTRKERYSHDVILKEPKRVFRIYFQRVVMLRCELNYPQMQNPFLPFELVALRASEFDKRGRLGGVGVLRLMLGKVLATPSNSPFSRHSLLST